MSDDMPERRMPGSKTTSTLTRPRPKMGLKQESGAERRRQPRYSCFLRAKILSHGGEESLSCNAYDISAQGMRLCDAFFATVPDRFLLLVPRRHLQVWVKVVRRQPNELGVQFIG